MYKKNLSKKSRIRSKSFQFMMCHKLLKIQRIGYAEFSNVTHHDESQGISESDDHKVDQHIETPIVTPIVDMEWNSIPVACFACRYRVAPDRFQFRFHFAIVQKFEMECIFINWFNVHNS